MTEVTATAAKTDNKMALGLVRKTTAFHINPRNIVRREGFNPRFDFGEIEGLARSIVSNGILNAIRVKKTAPGVFELVDGDRRFTAVELLLANHAGGKKDLAYDFPEGVPAVVVDAAQDEVTSLIQMFEANTGKPFLPLEKAHAFKRMKDAGLTLKDIEQRTGCSDNDIVGSLALLDADDTLKDAVKTGKVSGGLAKSIAVNARGDKAKQADLTKKAIDAGKDKKAKRAVLKEVDDVRRDKAAKKGLKLKIRALSDEDLSALGAAVAQHLAKTLESAGMSFDSDLREWIAKDKELQIAATFGALEALKAAAGVKVALTF